MFTNEVGTLCETHNNTFRKNAYLITLLFADEISLFVMYILQNII